MRLDHGEPPFDEDALAELSHALRTPLAVISGYAELLGTRADEATRLEAAVMIEEAVSRLSAILDDVLPLLAAPA